MEKRPQSPKHPLANNLHNNPDAAVQKDAVGSLDAIVQKDAVGGLDAIVQKDAVGGLDAIVQKDVDDLRDVFSGLQPDLTQQNRTPKKPAPINLLQQRLKQRIRKHSTTRSSNGANPNSAMGGDPLPQRAVIQTAPSQKIKTWLGVTVILLSLFTIGIGAGWAALKLPIARQLMWKEAPTKTVENTSSDHEPTPVLPTPSTTAQPLSRTTPAKDLGDAQPLKREESLALKRFLSSPNQALNRSLDNAANLAQEQAKPDGLRPNPLRFGLTALGKAPAQPALPTKHHQRIASKPLSQPNQKTALPLPNAIRSSTKRLSPDSQAAKAKPQAQSLAQTQRVLQSAAHPFPPTTVRRTHTTQKQPKSSHAMAIKPVVLSQTPAKIAEKATLPAKPGAQWLLQVGACQTKSCIAGYRKVVLREAHPSAVQINHGWISSPNGPVKVQRIQVLTANKRAGMLLKKRLKTYDSRFGYAYLIAPAVKP